MKKTILVLVALGISVSALAQSSLTSNADSTEKAGIYIIFDGSGSMWGQLPDKSHKVVVARQVLNEFVAGNFEGYDLALRAYGHRRKGDCRDSELVVPFGPPEEVIGQVQGFTQDLNPLGKTPISYSLGQALDDFGDRSGEIILISDGIETCDEDPCALVQKWQEKNVKIKVHVVGLGLEEEEKVAMQCISEAAGTTYHDAESADALAEGLREIQEETIQEEIPEGELGEFTGTPTTGFILKARDAQGRIRPAIGTLMQGDEERFQISTNRRNQVETGTYELIAGVQTLNGTVYKPVTQTVEMGATGETTVEIEVDVPPQVYTTFMDGDEQQRGSLVNVYQEGVEVFRFRWMDTVYVDPGTYEFRAIPNAENELSVTEVVLEDEIKEIVFEMVHTVWVTAKMVASGSDIWFRKNLYLWQDGVEKYMVHAHNGNRSVLPGTYDLHLEDDLTPYVEAGIVVTQEEKQHFDVTVPAGHVTVHYQKANGTRDKDERVWLTSLNPEASGRRSYQTTGKTIPLTPGRYRLEGWDRMGTYDPIEFEIQAGEEKEITLRDKG